MTQYMRPGGVLPTYMVFPRFLLLRQDIGDTAKLLYMVLLDRSRLSAQNESFQDEQGRVFVVYSIEHLAQALGKSTRTVKGALKDLEDAQLLERKRCGLGRANHLYVRFPANSGSFFPTVGAENGLSKGQKIASSERRELPTNKSYKKKSKSTIRSYTCTEEESL